MRQARTRIELASLEPPQVRACLMLAIEDALSIYDAAYLWLAMSLRLPLMTLDRKLAAAAGARGVVVITPEDIE
jgi:predicted nucleic acid-binding protein